jgi:hypothetical protein
MFRVSFASTLTAAGAVVLFYLIMKLILKNVFSNRDENGVSHLATTPVYFLEIPSLFGALCFAFSYQQWFQADGAKGGIYTLNTFLTMLILYILFLMRERGWFLKGFLLVAFIYGVSLTDHWPNQVVIFPGYVWLLLSAQTKVPILEIMESLFKLRFLDFWEKFKKAMMAFGLKNWILALTLCFVGFSLYTSLAMRANLHPVMNWWDPDNLTRLWQTIERKGYSGIGAQRSLITIHRNLVEFYQQSYDQFGIVFSWVILILAIWGLFWLFKRNRVLGWGLAILEFFVFLTIIGFNNPLKGYQWTLDNFFTPIYHLACFMAAAGVAGILEVSSKNFKSKVKTASIGGAALLLAFLPLSLNYIRDDQSRYTSSYDYGMNMLRTVAKNGVIICNGDIDILPLWYLQYVRGIRPDVTSFTMQLIPYSWARDPFFKRNPSLYVPVFNNVNPEVVVQNMINMHGNQRPFYFTNIFTAPWIRQKNPALPEGFLWRLTNTKNMNFPLTSRHLNLLWSGYCLHDLNPPRRRYWDPYTDVMKDSYGIGFDFTGYYALANKWYPLAVWCFKNALKYRQPQTWPRLYFMLAQSEIQVHDGAGALLALQKVDKMQPGNPLVYAKMGEAYLLLHHLNLASNAFQTSLRLDPNEAEAQHGLVEIRTLEKENPSLMH